MKVDCLEVASIWGEEQLTPPTSHHFGNHRWAAARSHEIWRDLAMFTLHRKCVNQEAGSERWRFGLKQSAAVGSRDVYDPIARRHACHQYHPSVPQIKSNWHRTALPVLVVAAAPASTHL